MLSEWHLSPDDILENWTDERLDVFWTKRNERMERMRLALEGLTEERAEQPRYVSNQEFFTAPIPTSNGRSIANPNATRLKRIQVMN